MHAERTRTQRQQQLNSASTLAIISLGCFSLSAMALSLSLTAAKQQLSSLMATRIATDVPCRFNYAPMNRPRRPHNLFVRASWS